MNRVLSSALLVSAVLVGGMATPALGDTSSAPAGTQLSVLQGSIANTEYTTCVVMTAGTVKCWGGDTMGGELGNGAPTQDSSVPVDVIDLTNVTSLASGNWHTCAVIDDGTVKCWGNGGNGALGNGSTTHQPAPVAVTGLTNVVALSAGYQHTCALIDDGTVKCWGRNDAGQLGLGTAGSAVLTPTTAVAGLSNVTAITAGNGTTCALIDDGTVKCWGNGLQGQLGNGTNTSSLSPVTVSGVTNAVAVSLGSTYFGCALLADSTVACWGDNRYGQLGNGTKTNRNTPLVISGLTGVLAVDNGNGSTCALVTGGTMKCWGGDGDDEFGPTLGSYILTPTDIPNVSDVVAFETGDYHTCVLLNTGGMRCFGANWYGELGNNDPSNSSDVVDVLNLTGSVGATTTTTIPSEENGGGELPQTGSNPAGPVALIASMLAVGAAIVVTRRRFV